MPISRLALNWHLNQWKHSAPDRVVLIGSRAGEFGVPKTFVAMVNNVPVGFVSLIENNVPSRPDLIPWLASLYVHDDFRGNGIGRTLVDRCLVQARVDGHSRLYLLS